jgi:preprotein translocase subunit SecA
MMRVFGGQQIASLMSRFNFPDDIPIENRLISRSIEQIQSKVEGVHFDARKRLVEYDDVANRQREIIYRVRDRVLTLADQEDFEALKNNLLTRVNQEIDNLIGTNFTAFSSESDQGEVNLQALVREFAEILPLDTDSQKNLMRVLAGKSQVKVEERLKELTNNFYQDLVKKMGERRLIEISKLVLLGTIDRLWVDHLDQMEELREGVAVRSYGQQDPLSIYRNEAFTQFEQLMSQIDYQVARRIFRVQFAAPNRPSIFQSARTNIDSQDGMGLVGEPSFPGQSKPENKVKTVVRETSQPGRNDPCPCGSGKKYKKCCYPKYG